MGVGMCVWVRRYTVSVSPADAVGSFEGTDKLSRAPKNQRVTFFVFDDADEFERYVPAAGAEGGARRH